MEIEITILNAGLERLESESLMETRKLALVIVGILFALAGLVFALQGAGVIGGSSLMSGNSTYIYVGAVVIIIGLILLGLGVMSKSKMTSTASAAPKQ